MQNLSTASSYYLPFTVSQDGSTIAFADAYDPSTGVFNLAAHGNDEDIVVVTEVHHVRRNAESRNEGARPALNE